MSLRAISAPTVLLSGQSLVDHAVIVDGELVTGISPISAIQSDIEIEKLNSGILCPGFIDIQVNGGGGVLFNDDPSVSTIETIGLAHRKFGTTGFLPTLITDDLDKVKVAISAVEEAIDKGVPGVLGIHLEGPFLNQDKRGIHEAEKMQELKEDHIELLTSLKNGVTHITLAPETTNPHLIELLVQSGAILSAGHSNGSYEDVVAGVRAGISGFTHLFNAMSPLQGREPGAVGAALLERDVWCGLIADGFHLHPATLELAIRFKGASKSILVTDAMPPVGTDMREFQLGEETIFVRDGKCVNASGTLAGSDLNMVRAVRYVTEKLSLPVVQAVDMATRSPAQFLGLNGKIGDLAPGMVANMLHVSEDWNVSKVWLSGDEHLV